MKLKGIFILLLLILSPFIMFVPTSRAGTGSFGNNVIGNLDVKASDLENNLPILAAYMFTAPDVDNMKVGLMYCYIKSVSGLIGINMAIYTNSNNAPGNLIVAGNGPESVGDTYGWCWVPPLYAASLGNGGAYWLVIYSTDDYYIKCVTDPGNIGFASQHYVGASFPDPFGSVDNWSNYEPSAYITYTTPYSTTTNFISTSVTGTTTTTISAGTSYSTTTLPNATYTVGTRGGENPIITQNVSATVSFLKSVTLVYGNTTTTECSTLSSTTTEYITTSQTMCTTECETGSTTLTTTTTESGNTTFTTCNTSCSTESMTLYTTSTFTTFVTTATLNTTSISTSFFTTVTTSVSSSVGILGTGWNILEVPIIIFFGLTIIIIVMFRRRR